MPQIRSAKPGKTNIEIIGKLARDTKAQKLTWFYERVDEIARYYSVVPITDEKELIFFFNYDLYDVDDSYMGIYFNKKGEQAVTVRMINDFKNFKSFKTIIDKYGIENAR